MALVTRAFLDTSVLLGGLIDMGPAVASAQRVMAAVAGGKLPGARTAWHCCLEFYAVATRLPEELRLSPEDAAQLVESEILSRFEVRQLPDRRHLEFFRSVAIDRIVGGRLYDAHIAEVARSAGAALIVTENRRHFTALLKHGIRVLTAAELSAELDRR